MSIYNYFIEKAFLPVGDILLDTHFMADLKRWRSYGKLDAVSLEKIQKESLTHLLQYSIEYIPFYQRTNIAQRQNIFEWLRSFPIMYKSTIQENLDDLIFVSKDILVCEKSSGSSGIQGEVYMTRKEQFNAIALQTYLWEWAGYRLGEPLLQLGMTLQRSSIKSIKDNLLRTNYQQAFKIDDQSAKKALQHFRGRQGFFGGYASGLYAYACIAERLNIDISFNGVISWGDKMFDHYRNKIEEVFHTQVFDIYGTTEGFVISGQCEFGSHHIMNPHVYLELLDESGMEVAPGKPGYVVVTRLDAYAMPLIRYYLGDIAIKASPDDLCSCGRPFPILKMIIGRDTDIIRTNSGKYLIVHFFTGIFEHIAEIKQFRVIQNNLMGINIEYIPGSNFNIEILDTIKNKILNYIKEPFNITFQEVKNIISTNSGKPQMIHSTLNNPILHF